MKMPIMLEMENRRILIVGGGKIGFRKALKMLSYGADITCVSETFVNEFCELAQTRLKLIVDAYKTCYLSEMQLVIAATNNERVNSQIYLEATRQGVMCMCVDKNSPSDFDFMATRKKDRLTIAVSTDGISPGFSKEIITKLTEAISDEDMIKLDLSSRLRKNI